MTPTHWLIHAAHLGPCTLMLTHASGQVFERLTARRDLFDYRRTSAQVTLSQCACNQIEPNYNGSQVMNHLLVRRGTSFMRHYKNRWLPFTRALGPIIQLARHLYLMEEGKMRLHARGQENALVVRWHKGRFCLYAGGTCRTVPGQVVSAKRIGIAANSKRHCPQSAAGRVITRRGKGEEREIGARGS